MAESKQQSDAENGHFVVFGSNISAKGQWQAVVGYLGWLQDFCVYLVGKGFGFLGIKFSSQCACILEFLVCL